MEKQATDTAFESLTLAALFYDIGRFKRRALAENTPARVVGEAWLRERFPQVAAALVPWQALIAEAAALSAGGELPEEPYEDAQALQPLVSVFSKVSLPEREPYTGQERYYPLAALSEEPVYPCSQSVLSRQHYKALWDDFETALGQLAAGRAKEISVSQALFLLEKFTSFIPAFPSW